MLLGAELNTLTPEELDQGWIRLFDGETTYSWLPTSEANWRVRNGILSVSEGERGLLCTTTQFADYILKCDFRSSLKTNSGIFLRTPLKPHDVTHDCYELNIAGDGVSPYSTGSFVNRKKAAAGLHSTKWQRYEVLAQGGHFVVKLDGKVVLDYLDPKPVRRGHIGLQLNSGKVEFRNIKLKPLGLKSMFNGKDLTGWHVYPGKKSIFRVTPEGYLNVKNGSGQLESDEVLGDFVLQLDIFSNGKHLNSGIFFRSIPGKFTQGYESQIQNGFHENDRSKPTDYGTGGIYRRQPARKVVADDFTWFHKTIIADGPHIAVWVNGYQVTDWTDTRQPNENPRQGLRTTPGTISIQGHDPTTDLSFRNIRGGEMPKR